MSKDLEPIPDKIDGNTGQVVEVHPSTAEIVSRVTKFIDSKEKKVFFNGKRYAEYDDFQYIGSCYGITVKTFDPHFVEINGRKGFHAKAMLLKDQEEIGRAEAFCLDDEPNWRHKPLFQLASMAQTRAAAKAYSNLFRPIVRMAGLEGSPAEEMDSDTVPLVHPTEDPKIKALGERINRKPTEDEFGPLPESIDAAEEPMTEKVASKSGPDELQYLKDEIPFGDPPPEANVKCISEKQRKFLWVKCKNAAVPEAALKSYIKQHWNTEHTDRLPWQAMDPLLKWIDSFAALKTK